MGKRLTTSGVPWCLTLLALLFYLYAYWSYAGALLRFPFDHDQGEGFDVYSGILLGQGRWIYNDNSLYPFYSSNYPPVYAILVSLAVRFVGPSLLAGRLISVVASCLIGVLIYAIVGRRTGSRMMGAVAGLAFFASTYVYHVTPLARVNASLALFALLGVYCMEQLRWRWLALGTLFLLLALYTKQNAVDAVAASLIYLFIRHWRRAGLVGVALGALAGTAFYLLDRQSSGQFYLNVVEANFNPFDWIQSAQYFRNFFEIHAVLLGLAAVGLALAAWRRRVSIYHLYALSALLVSAGAGKWGAGESYFLNAIVAICVVVGLTLADLRTILPALARPALPLLLLLQMPLLWHGPIDGTGWGLIDRGPQRGLLGQLPTSQDETAGWSIVSYVEKSRGDVLLEESGFALADQRPVIGNPSHLLNLSRQGRWGAQSLVDALEQRQFGLVVLTAHFYPQPVLDAIGDNYSTADIIHMDGQPYRILTPSPVQAQNSEPRDEVGVAPAGPEASVEAEGRETNDSELLESAG